MIEMGKHEEQTTIENKVDLKSIERNRERNQGQFHSHGKHQQQQLTFNPRVLSPLFDSRRQTISDNTGYLLFHGACIQIQHSLIIVKNCRFRLHIQHISNIKSVYANQFLPRRQNVLSQMIVYTKFKLSYICSITHSSEQHFITLRLQVPVLS